jgi:hypothetical protein
VYRWIAANGVVHYSDAPSDDSEGAATETVAVPVLPAAEETYRRPRNARDETDAARVLDSTISSTPMELTESSAWEIRKPY